MKKLIATVVFALTAVATTTPSFAKDGDVVSITLLPVTGITFRTHNTGKWSSRIAVVVRYRDGETVLDITGRGEEVTFAQLQKWSQVKYVKKSIVVVENFSTAYAPRHQTTYEIVQ